MRLPVARLAAAHAKLKENMADSTEKKAVAHNL